MDTATCGGCGRYDETRFMMRHDRGEDVWVCNGGPCWNAVDRRLSDDEESAEPKDSRPLHRGPGIHSEGWE